MIKATFFLLFLSITLYGKEDNVIYCRYVDELQSTFIYQLSKTELILPYCIGGDLFNDVDKIILGLYIFDYANIKEAREIYLKFVQTYLTLINSYRKIRPYLHNYPATIENLSLSLIFEGHPKKVKPKEDIVSVRYSYGEILYIAPGGVDIYRETYAKALEELEKEKSLSEKS